KGSVTVKSGAVFEVTKGRNNDVAANKLVIGADASFTVSGTLTITGTLDGTVKDKGTINFNGVADDATIVIYDGVTLDIASVTGNMKITDSGIISTTGLATPYYIEDGNVVELLNVKGISITEVVSESKKYNTSGVNTNVFSTSMTVGGVISAVEVTGEDNSVLFKDGMDSSAVVSPKGTKVNYIYSTINIEDVTVGEDVGLNLSGAKVTVSGTVNVLSEGTSITTSGPITVSGAIVIGPKSDSHDDVDLSVNGMVYTIADASTFEKTVYYTSFDAAMATINTVDDKTITVLGSVTAKGTPVVPADCKVYVTDGASLSIDSAAVMTVESTALLDASDDGKISVSGSLVIMDKETGLEYRSGTYTSSGKDYYYFSYQVYTENGDVATYSGLAPALQNAVSGDVITLRQSTTLSSSATINEGVTLVIPANNELKIGSSTKDVILTVNGMLDIQRNGILTSTGGSTYREAIVLNGVIRDAASTTALEVTGTSNVFEIDDFVTFNMKVDGKEVLIYSGLAYAAENATYGDVTVYGDVTAGDIAFTNEDEVLTIRFSGVGTGSITVSSMMLNGEEMKITPAGGKLTGSFGNEAGMIALSNTGGIIIESDVYEDVDGSTVLLYVQGTLTGSMVVETGTVTMNGDVTVGAYKDDLLTIASGAVLATGNNVLNVVEAQTPAGVSQYTALSIEGTL
ncbi:MAG: hypothetical protein IKA33_04750, partial [Candidatus Methanomethylophilaceae archaeon]|nr:hypothetical protein [Candidatus Methanomethylophilaceae archaeon]